MKKLKLILDGALAAEIYKFIDIIVSGKENYDGSSNLLSMKLKLNGDGLK